MTEQELKSEMQERMEKAFHYIQEKVKKVRTGLAQASLVEEIKVSSYGSEQEIKHIATISCPDFRSIVISPWDQNLLKDIEATLIKSNLGMTPQIDKRVIRLRVPELTEASRKELIRSFKKDIEKSRIEFRHIRQMMNKKIRQSLKEKKIGEDMGKSYEDEVQKMTDSFIEKVNEISEKKQEQLIRV